MRSKAALLALGNTEIESATDGVKVGDRMSRRATGWRVERTDKRRGPVTEGRRCLLHSFCSKCEG
jgi:hypothetical protein